jgi:hypothetical protein
MKWTPVLLSALLLGGCSRASMPDLEDVPPASQSSAESQPSTGEVPVVAVSNGAVVLTSEQRMDIQHGVTRGLADPSLARFGSMTAGISQFTPQAYIVCGWVDPGNDKKGAGYEPFVAMFVPKTRTALLIGVGNSEDRGSAVRQRCVAEGVALGT